MEVLKRDGRVQPFQSENIYNAVFKAYTAAGCSEEESKKAASSVKKRVTDKVIHSGNDRITAEEIQNLVIHAMVKATGSKGMLEASTAYIRFCTDREKARSRHSSLMRTIEEITFASSTDSNVKRDNGNVNGDSAMGMMLHYGSAVTKDFTDNFLLSEKVQEAVKQNLLYIHDKDFYPMGTLTCTQIPLDKLFETGFNTGHGQIRPPQSIQSAAALTAVVIQANQNDNHGGQAVPLLDFYLAPYVTKTFKKNFIYILKTMLEGTLLGRKEKTAIAECFLSASDEDWKFANKKALLENSVNTGTLKEYTHYLGNKCWMTAYKKTAEDTHQAMESLLYNLNTLHSRAGAQVPFSSLNFGMDTSQEGRMISFNFLRCQYEGLGNHETPIFPISIIQVKDGINYKEGDPNYDLFKYSMKVSAKRMFPNYCFIDAPFNLQYYKPDDKETIMATMGCRTRVIGNINGKSTPVGRGNLSFSTINLVKLGILYGTKFRHDNMENQALDEKSDIACFDREGFYKALGELMDVGIQQLLERYELQKSKHACNFPFLMGQHLYRGSDALNPEDEIGDVVKQGTLSLGFIGLAECLTALTGHHHAEIADNPFWVQPKFSMKHKSTALSNNDRKNNICFTQLNSLEEVNELGYDIILYMRRKLDKATAEYGLNFSLLATPSEGLSGRFTEKDKAEFGIIQGVTDRKYYTNSNHVPVWFPIGFQNKVQIEAPYHELTNAGHICYVEMDGDPLDNLKAFEDIVRCMKESGIGYGAINHAIDTCPYCGYQGIIEDICPQCQTDFTETFSNQTCISCK